MEKTSKKILLSSLFLISSLTVCAKQEYSHSPALVNGLSAYYGILLFTILVTLAQFFISKDKAYFYYAFYVGTGLFLYGIWQEVDFNFLGLGEREGFKRLAFHGGMPTLIFGYAVYCQFVVEFLNLPQKRPALAKRLKKIFRAFLLLIVFDQIVYCLLRYGFSNIYEQVYPPIRIFFLLPTVLLCFLAIIQIFKVKNELAKVILFGTVLYFLISLVGFYTYAIARNTEDALLSNTHPTFFNQLGFFCEIIIFSIGLGYRMKIAEEEKEIANRNYIKQLAENRVLEIANTQAEKEQEINQIRSRFYTNITHEFRTPLTVIMGMSERIEGYETERKLISRNSQNLLRLINQLLDLSKLESGHLKIQEIQSDVIAYLRYLTESFYSMATDKNITLHFEASEEVLLMDYDEEKLQHIIYNLLSNAIKFSKEGGAILICTSITNASFLLIEVRDTGIGIAKDQLPYIFDRFYQVREADASLEGGTGIGLSLTKELIELMEGNIEVDSEVNKGTTFKVRLPIQNKAPLKISNPKPVISLLDSPESSMVKEIPQQQEKKSQLLLIEDNRDIALYIQQLLQEKYQISWALNGAEGIQKAIKDLPDIIISDVMMPKKNGYEVCETLKADERTSHIPIILLTAKAQQSDKLRGLEHGADVYLMKPFDKSELWIRLEKLLLLRQTLLEKYSQKDYLSPVLPTKEPSIEDIFLQKVRDAIEVEVGNAAFSIPDLCKALHLSNIQLYRKLKALTGKTPSQFIRSYRLHKARHLLQTTSLNISEIAYDLGFTDPGYFTRVFKKEFGATPSHSTKI